MKHRPAPSPTKFTLPPRLKYDSQVIKWAQRLAGDPDARPDDLDEDQLTFVLTEVMKRREGFEPTAFNKAMKETCPILAAPDFTDTVDDLGHIFAQPEMQEFWRALTGPRGARGSKIDYAGAKGVMSFMSMSGVTPYIDDARDCYMADTRLQELVGQVEAATFGRWPQAAVELAPYKSLVRHVKKAAPSCWREAMRANIAMVRALALLRPGEGIGERLLIDGSSVPAWCQQKAGKKGSERDLALRKRTPHAGFRAYTYKNGGKEAIDPNAKLGSAVGRSSSKWWRGYYLVVIADQATGLPLVWTLIDAATDEARAIVPLLRDLYELWPDIPAKPATRTTRKEIRATTPCARHSSPA